MWHITPFPIQTRNKKILTTIPKPIQAMFLIHSPKPSSYLLISITKLIPGSVKDLIIAYPFGMPASANSYLKRKTANLNSLLMIF